MVDEVVVGIVEKDNKFLIVKRKIQEDNLTWVFPGGKVEERESPEKAVMREVIEESGIKCKIRKYLGNRLHPNSKKRVGYYACKYVSGEIKLTDEEIIDAKWVEFNEFQSYFTSSLFQPVADYITSLN